MRRSTAVGLLVAWLVAGCGGGSGTDTTAAPASTPAPATTPAPSSSLAPATTLAAATTRAPATTLAATTLAPATTAAPARPVLRGNGLGVVNFGASKDETISALVNAFGGNGIGQWVATCAAWGPNSFVLSYQNLRANIIGGVFKGYSYGRPLPSLGLKTAAGVGEGMDVAAAKAAHGAANVVAPGLPPEFGPSIKITTADGPIIATASAAGDAGKLVDFLGGQSGCE